MFTIFGKTNTWKHHRKTEKHPKLQTLRKILKSDVWFHNKKTYKFVTIWKKVGNIETSREHKLVPNAQKLENNMSISYTFCYKFNICALLKIFKKIDKQLQLGLRQLTSLICWNWIRTCYWVEKMQTAQLSLGMCAWRRVAYVRAW